MSVGLVLFRFDTLCIGQCFKYFILTYFFDPGQNSKSAQTSGVKDCRVVRWFALFLFVFEMNKADPFGLQLSLLLRSPGAQLARGRPARLFQMKRVCALMA